MTKEQLHKTVFDDVKHVLGGAPGLSDLTRTSLATQAAVRLTHHLKDSLRRPDECLRPDEE